MLLLGILILLKLALFTIHQKPEAIEIKQYDNYLYDFVPDPALKNERCLARSSYSIFYYQTARVCPLEYNPICDDPIFDPEQKIGYRCQLNMKTNSVVMTNSTGLLDLLRAKDPMGRNWCMITMFYTHNCPFSAKLAPSFNMLPSLYDNLLVVALDASEFSILNFRYGISGTPTVIFWVNGIGVLRMSMNMLNMTAFNTFIQTVSDLVPQNNKVSTVDNFLKTTGISVNEKMDGEAEGLYIRMEGNQSINTYYAIFCFFFCVIAFAYEIRERILLKASVFRWIRSRFGATRCDNIYFLLYLDPPRFAAGREPQRLNELPPLLVEE